jgi:anti-sigma28 factor (negative regulator of flagellin synthesis)
MDPFDNPRMGERPVEDPGQPTEAPACTKQPSDSESPIDQARREKIEQLKKAVADGTYNVSAEEVARKLIEHMLEPKE